MASRPTICMEELIRRKVFSLRYWKKTKLYKKHSNWKFKFSVMTYNILSQNAIENHRFLYRNCNPSFLMEDYRVSRILPEILQSRTDIICLQEVEEYVYEVRMRAVFEMNGFGSIFMRRTTDKTDGCAIVWRKDKFQLVGQNRIEFRTGKSQLLNRDNIGLIAVLRPNHHNGENIRLHVATTHLLFNPKRGDVKLCQLRWLLAELDKMALIEVKDEVRHYHPVILCGDFNFEPNSPLYQFVENGRIHVDNAMSGDLSGQAEGRNGGRRVKFENLLLHKLGISDASRFEKIPPKRNIPPTALQTNSDPSAVSATDSNGKTESNPAESKPIVETEPCPVDSKSMDVCDLAPTKCPELSTATDSDDQKTEIHTPVLSESTQSKEFDQPGPNHVNSPAESAESTECFSHDFKFVPAYNFHNLNQKSLPITSMVGRDFNTVDHIFYTVDSKDNPHAYREGALKLLSVYTLLNAEDLKELGGLPNAGFGSDHICLGAQFAICFHNRRR